MRPTVLAFCAAWTVMLADVLPAGTNWPNWRGPNYNGSAEASDLPTTLRPDEAAWSLPLPGPAGSTPAIYDGRLYLTSTEQGSENLIAMCLDAVDGSLIWKKTLSRSESFPERNTPASPSPIVDAERVYILFGNGEFIALDHDGVELWRRNIEQAYGPLSLLYGYGSSPRLFEDVLYVPVIRRPEVYTRQQSSEPLESYLLAVDPATGETVFYQPRPSQANDEATNSYITPVVAHIHNEPYIVLFGADYLTTHDPKTGREEMRYQYDLTRNSRARTIPTPIAEGRMLYAALPRGDAAAAYDLSEGGEPLRWRTDSGGPDVSSPALYNRHLYMIEDRTKMLVCVDVSRGRVRWKGQLDQKARYFSSVTAADGKIYTVNEAGVVNVVAADPSAFRLLSTTDFGQGPVHSSIAVADHRLYLRTAERLYCFQAAD